MARYVPQLETLFTGGFVTMVNPSSALVQADVGKAVELNTANGVIVASDGGAIFGKLHSVDPKGDVVVVQVAGYVSLPVVAGSQAGIAVGNAVTGYVVGGGAGTVKNLLAATIADTTFVLQLLASPKKVVYVPSPGTATTAIIDLGAKIA